MLWSPILHRRGCPIRKSTDRCLFTAPRGLSQLVTSFFGSWCQGIHLMLFFAWTSFFLSYLLLWVSQIIFVLQWKSFFRCFLWSSAISDGLIVVFYPISFSEKPDFKILKKLSVRFNIFIRFSMIFHLFFAIHYRCSLFLSGRGNLPLVGSSGLEPPTSCLSGTRSNLLSYEPI